MFKLPRFLGFMANESPARQEADDRIQAARALSRAMMAERNAETVAVLEAASTTQILGAIAMVHPERILAAAGAAHEEAERLLVAADLPPTLTSDQISNYSDYSDNSDYM